MIFAEGWRKNHKKELLVEQGRVTISASKPGSIGLKSRFEFFFCGSPIFTLSEIKITNNKRREMMGKGSGVLKKRVFRSLFVTMLAMPVSSALAADVPNIFVDGDTASASEVNANFKDLSDRAFDKTPTGISYSEGNVGIGTTSPEYKLDIGPQGTPDDPQSHKSNIRIGDGHVITNSANGALVLNAGPDDGQGQAGIWFRKNTTLGEHLDFVELMRITDSGNVGIGTTNPRAKLDVVEGNVNIPGIIVRKRTSAWNLAQFANLGAGAYNSISSDGDVGIIFSNGAIDSDTDLVIAPWSSGASGIKIQADGNVGIGTTSPGDVLTVHAPASSSPVHAMSIDVKSFATTANAQVSHFFRVRDLGAGTSPFVIRGDGNVGIGTTSPSYKLHVNGTAAGTSWTNLSSREYKEGIQKVDESKHSVMLASLMDMDLTTYKYKEEYGGDDTTKLGFIAEEMPREVLSKDGKGVDVYELLTFTIGAMKAQQEEIKGLNAKLKQNEALEARLAKVEALLNAAQ